MRDKAGFGKRKIFVMLGIFVAILLVVGLLMRSKMQILLSGYVEKQVAEQGDILAKVLEEDLNAELKNLENIATYIEADNESMGKLIEYACLDEPEALWGVMELGSNVICGAPLATKEFSGIQDSFRGNDAVSYQKGKGILFTVPVFRGSNIKYVLFKFYPEEQLVERFGLDFYGRDGKVFATDREEQIVIPYEGWTEEDLSFFKQADVQEVFASISDLMNVSTAAAKFYESNENSKYLFVSEVGELDILLVGMVDQSVAEEGIASIITLVLWVFGLLLMLLAIGMAFLFGAEEKAMETEELREAKLIADSANQAKSDFLASMSHEIRTPINAVMGMNEMILRECEDESIKEYAVNIQNASKTLLSLINDILDLSKIEAGKMEMVPDNYELSSVLNDVVNMTQIKAKQKKLDFLVDVDETIPNKLFGDEVRIRQIILNILNNAVKYTKEGNVHLYVSQEKETEDRIVLKIAVKDTGIGIREEDMEKLFGSFERLDAKKNRNVEGTGLGLAITSKMIELMNGKLDVESKYGEGSIFTVRIPQPVVEDTAIGDFGDRFSQYVQSMKSYTESFIAPTAEVLVVDDNEMNLFVAEKLLKNTKVKVTCCESGEKALEQVKKKTFDVILLDHLMEGMDGIETLKQIKSVSESLCKQTPAIALTANAFMGVREMYLSEGFDDYLSKPIVAEKLEEMLRKYIPAEKIILTNGNKNIVKEERKADIQTVVSVEKSNEEKVVPVQKKETVERVEVEKVQKTTKTIEKKSMLKKEKQDVGVLKEFYHKVTAVLFREELEIQHKLMNLILLAAFVGGSIAFVISGMIGVSAVGVLVIGLLVLVVAVCLWIANIKRKPEIAAPLIVIVANLVIFPVMYFFCGGIHSGMPVWLVLGMIFSWLILKGKICIILYTLNALTVAGCLILEYYMPQWVVPLEDEMSMVFDMIQSIIVVTCIFGAIFKYQTYVYEKQKREILKANQAKSEFLSNMSHEIRTPINAILGYNEMIMRETGESQTIEYGLNVQSAGRTLLSLVNDILDFASMEKVEWTLNCEPYSTLSLLQDIFAYAEYCTEKKKLEIQLDIDENIPQSLFGDVVRMMQIINNLISNAVKYTKEGHVKVSIHWKELSEKQGILKVQVKDTGIGMKEEDLQKISESFVRFDAQQTRNIQGTGLGLSIVTRLLHLMDSRLDVKSELGVGSEFSFELLQDIVERAPIGKYERSRTYKLTDTIEECFEAPEVRALVVDDNLTNLDLVKGILKMTQMQIDTAENGKEAVELVRKNSYHIVLMDHMMPIMDGIEALQVMRKEKLCEHTPIIVLTANVIQGAREGYLEAGFDDYLSKPIYSKDLFKMLKKYLPEELRSVSPKESVKKEEVSEQIVKEQKTLAERLPSLDVETGLTYCCNSEEFYRDILKSYYESNKYEDILKSYEMEDWDKYRILVHALKSTSLSIGAAELSEAAKQLEVAAKELNVDYIKEYHSGVMENYKNILSEVGAALEDKPIEMEEEEVVEDNTFDKVSVLVVDDDTMNLQVAAKMLGEYCHVDCVKSGREALEFLRDNHPNLILLDIHMPEMNGFETIRKIKDDKYLKDIPVIFLTADNDRESEVQGFREGAMDFVTKPFIADTLIQRVKCILENDHLRKNLQKEVKKQTKQAEERREKVERLSLQITTALADTIDAKDSYTNGHSVRVAKYAKEIAKRVGKTEQEQENIYYAGLLHDIGKIGIPRLIINKTSVLTDDEYEMIKSHSKIGADILENMKDLPELSVGAHWHHERYDGKGYPDKLKGEEIPEIARIIGVADAYDAMTSKRSYRDILPQKVVREEITKGRGTQFDPQFADIMIQMIDEDVEYKNIES